MENHAYHTSSTVLTNFLLEPRAPIGQPQHRMLSYQRYWGISPHVLSQELAEHDLKVEEIVEDSTLGELPLG